MSRRVNKHIRTVRQMGATKENLGQFIDRLFIWRGVRTEQRRQAIINKFSKK